MSYTYLNRRTQLHLIQIFILFWITLVFAILKSFGFFLLVLAGPN
uniref:Uncharacterized protein n=1 Tax=Rhizophora mucronata TaxID=61149 RepID=A0A2P2ISV2_RHIMU